MKNYDKDMESSYLMYLDANNLYGWAMSQKLPVKDFKWVKKLSKLDEPFVKDYNENSDKGYFLEADVEYPKIHSMELHSAELRSIFKAFFHFYQKEIKLKTLISLFATYMTKKTILCI